MAEVEEGYRRRDKLSLRVRKEGKISASIDLQQVVRNDQHRSHESQVPVTAVPQHKSCAESDNR